MKSKNADTMKLNWDADHGYWRMAKNMGTGQDPAHYPKLKVDYDNEGQFTFVIQNGPPGVTFATQNPFGEKTGKMASKDFNEQFIVSPSTDGKTLVVTDLNATKGGGKYDGKHYAYELHFSSGPSVDPIITNGGCCGGSAPPIQNNNLAYYAVGAVALLAILWLVLRPMLNRNSAPVMKDIDQG